MRRQAGGRGRGGAVQSHQVRGGISGAGDSVLPERGGPEAGGNRSCGGAAKSVCAAGDKTFLRAAHAVVCARTGQGTGEVHRRTRGVGGGVRPRPESDCGAISPHRTPSGAFGQRLFCFAVRARGAAFRRRAWGFCEHHVGKRKRKPYGDRRRDCVSAFAGAV